MNFIRYVNIFSTLLILPIGATEITRGQQAVCPQNPHLVARAGEAETPESREKFINGMKKASRYVRAAAWGCGAASLGCLAAVICSESTKLRIGLGILSPLFAMAALLFDKVSTVQAAMARNRESIETKVAPDTQPTPAKLIDVADGVHIFSGAHCPPCKLLHKALAQIQEALPELAFFEYTTDGNNDETQAMIKRMGITILSIPLTVVIKDGAIARIIVGYSGIDDYVQKLNEALK